MSRLTGQGGFCMLALMLMYTLSGIFLSLISIPLIYGKIGPLSTRAGGEITNNDYLLM